MTTITANVGLSDDEIRVSAPLVAEHYIKIDSEIMCAHAYVVTDERLPPEYRDKLTWVVERGQFATLPATHTSGATVTIDPQIGGGGGSISATDGTTTVDPATSLRFPAGTLTDLGGGEAGVVLVNTLIGPFPVAYNTPGLQAGDGSANFADIPAGTIVVRAWLVPLTTWTADDIQDFIIGLASDATPGNFVQITAYNITGGSFGAVTDADIAAEVAFQSGVVFSTQPASPIVAAAVGACHLTGEFDATNATGGTGSIYAIIATPAA